MNTDDSENPLSEEIERLDSYSRELSNNSEKIDFVFDDVFSSDRIENGFQDYFSTMEITLYDIVDEGDESDIASDLINIVNSFNKNIYEELDERNSSLASQVRDLSKAYNLAIQRRLNRVQQGHDYWSNVKSDIGVRSDYPTFSHELLIDHEDVVNFDSGITGTSILSRHLLQQVLKAPDVLGKDILMFVNREEIEKINQKSQKILEKMDDYESDKEREPLAEEKSPEEESGDETEDQ